METGQKQTTENFVKEVRRRTRRTFTSEQKILIGTEAIRGELTVVVKKEPLSLQEQLNRLEIRVDSLERTLNKQKARLDPLQK